MMNIIGQLFGTSGYANHCRYLANALSKLTKCSLQTSLIPNWESQVNDAELKMIKTDATDEINLIVTHPVFWRVNAMAKRNFVYLVWEGDRVPDYFIEECLNPNIEKIIVPSHHTCQALYQTAVDYDSENFGKEDYRKLISNLYGGQVHEHLMKKTEIIPHGVDLDIFNPIETEKSDHFKFLANKGLTNLEDRGGLQYLIEAFVKEFGIDEKVELVLKINTAYGAPDLLGMFPYLKDPIPKMTVIAQEYTTKQLNQLYNECDIFVSPTRSEAFNIPCLEAMACGKPVITTDFGGQTDFCSQETGWMLDYELTEVKHDLQYEGIQWATPNIDHLRKALRQAFEDKDNCKRLGETAKLTAQKYTWDNTAKQIHSLI